MKYIINYLLLAHFVYTCVSSTEVSLDTLRNLVMYEVCII